MEEKTFYLLIFGKDEEEIGPQIRKYFGDDQQRRGWREEYSLEQTLDLVLVLDTHGALPAVKRREVFGLLHRQPLLILDGRPSKDAPDIWPKEWLTVREIKRAAPVEGSVPTPALPDFDELLRTMDTLTSSFCGFQARVTNKLEDSLRRFDFELNREETGQYLLQRHQDSSRKIFVQFADEPSSIPRYKQLAQMVKARRHLIKKGVFIHNRPGSPFEDEEEDDREDTPLAMVSLDHLFTVLDDKPLW